MRQTIRTALENKGKETDSISGSSGFLAVFLPIAGAIVLASIGIEATNAQELKESAVKEIASLINEKRMRAPAQKKLDSRLLYYLKMSRGEAISPEVLKLDSVLQTVEATNGMVRVDVKTDGSAQVVSELTSL